MNLFYDFFQLPQLPKAPQVYIIKGDPIGMARPRFSTRYGCLRCYDDQKQLRQMLCGEIMRQHDNQPPYMGALEMRVTFYFAVPSRMGIKKRFKFDNTPAEKKPDIDNALKMLMDNGQQAGLYHNDLQITRLIAQKVYTASEARTEFCILEI